LTLNLIEGLWDVVEETLQSAGLLLCQYKILTKYLPKTLFYSVLVTDVTL